MGVRRSADAPTQQQFVNLFNQIPRAGISVSAISGHVPAGTVISNVSVIGMQINMNQGGAAPSSYSAPVHRSPSPERRAPSPEYALPAPLAGRISPDCSDDEVTSRVSTAAAEPTQTRGVRREYHHFGPGGSLVKYEEPVFHLSAAEAEAAFDASQFDAAKIKAEIQSMTRQANCNNKIEKSIEIGTTSEGKALFLKLRVLTCNSGSIELGVETFFAQGGRTLVIANAETHEGAAVKAVNANIGEVVKAAMQPICTELNDVLRWLDKPTTRRSNAVVFSYS